MNSVGHISVGHISTGHPGEYCSLKCIGKMTSYFDKCKFEDVTKLKFEGRILAAYYLAVHCYHQLKQEKDSE